jgi:hypothetical protein
MNPRVDFWTKSYEWPRDGAGFIFLARALHLLGRAMFPDEWTGDETKIELYQSLPDTMPHASSGRAYFAHSLLMKHRPDLNRETLRWAGDRARGFSTVPPPVSFSKDEWAIALSIVKENHDTHRPAILRLYQVKSRIIELAESDKLITAVRPLAGGNPTMIPSSWWNTERADCRFDFCQMNPKKPFGVGSAGDDYQWIYVKEDHLLGAIHQIVEAANAPSVPASVLNKGGRPDEYNWDEMKEFARQLVETKGLPNRGNRSLPTKAQLIEAVTNEFAKTYDQHPAQSSVRRRVNSWLSEFDQN